MAKELEFNEIAAQYCEVEAEKMTDNMRFREDLGFSSLDFMSFLGELEDTFDVELDPERLLGIKTIGDAFGMLKNMLQEA